jgi:DNA polymerase-3 subunit gamma/tau
MSADTVLARKWRPRQFSEVVGQEAVVRALSQALTSGRLHHAYLFTGTRGVGKTTLARIFAKALNCRDGVTVKPCQDDIARQIDEGRFVDLIEIDAASRTKVEDTRELLDNVQYAPSVGRFKIYIIDEVHMLSTHSFNALLKTLEEPPAHVKFLLATTDPHKLPVTILSRCLQFHLRPMTPEILQLHLAKILQAEGIAFDPDAIALISRMAQGSVRDSLSLLDQAIVLGGGSVGYDSTREMLGLASDTQLLIALQALAAADASALLEQLQAWIGWGADFDRLQQQLLARLHQLAMVQSFPALAVEYEAEWVALAEQVSPEQVQIWLQVALLAQDDMRLAPTAQMGFELMFMRLLHFRAASSPVMGAASAVPKSSIGVTQSSSDDTRKPSQPSGGDSAYQAALAALGIQKTSSAEKKTLAFAKTDPLACANTATNLAESSLSLTVEALLQDESKKLPEQSKVVVQSVEDWQVQLKRWQLTGAALEVANQCVRVLTEDAHEVRLVCPPKERVGVALLQDKLAQALLRVDSQLKLTWYEGWSDTWLSPALHHVQVSASEKAQAKSMIESHPRFRQLCQSLSLTPNWDQFQLLT